MMYALLALILYAGTPSVKGNKLLDDGQAALQLKTQKIPGGAAATTVTTLDGAVVVIFMLSPIPGQAMLNADFQGLGVNFGGMVPETKADDVLLDWWKAGVLTAQGGDLAALEAWTKARNLTLINTAANQAKMAAAAAKAPVPTFSPPPAASSGSGSSGSGSSGSSAPAAPSTVSVTLRFTCKENVRLFLGASKSSGGTYGWESYNSTRSVTVKPGSVICLADKSDHNQTCWTAGTERTTLEVGCGGFTER